MIKGQLGLELVFISLDCITIFLNIAKFIITVKIESLVERPAFDKQLHVRPDVRSSRPSFSAAQWQRLVPAPWAAVIIQSLVTQKSSQFHA